MWLPPRPFTPTIATLSFSLAPTFLGSSAAQRRGGGHRQGGYRRQHGVFQKLSPGEIAHGWAPVYRAKLVSISIRIPAYRRSGANSRLGLIPGRFLLFDAGPASRYSRLMARLMLVVFLVNSALAADESVIAPHWIWSKDAGAPSGPVEFVRVFDTAGVVSSATLQVAADFCRASIELNGQAVLVVEPYSSTVQLDVTPHVARGQNKLLIRADRSCGPSAVALSLALKGAGRQQAIVTDRSWSMATDLGPVEPELWGIGRRSATLDPFDNYEQWRTALGAAASGDTAAYWLAPGFQLSAAAHGRRGGRAPGSAWRSIRRGV